MLTQSRFSPVTSSNNVSATAMGSQQMNTIKQQQYHHHHNHQPHYFHAAMKQMVLAKTNEELFDETSESKRKAEPIKPRNFAEVVAKKVSAPIAHSSSSNSSSASSLDRTPINLNPKTILDKHKATHMIHNGLNAQVSLISSCIRRPFVTTILYHIRIPQNSFNFPQLV